MLVALLLAVAAPSNGFTVVGPEGDGPVGRLVRIAPDGTIGIATESGTTMVRDAYQLRRAGVAIPSLPRGPVLLTTTGDRIPLRKTDSVPISGDDQTLKIRPAFSESDWEVPVAFASLAWLNKPPAATPTDITRYAWLPSDRNRDILRLRNGDTAAGTFTGFQDGLRVRLKPEDGAERQIPLDQISAIAFNPTLARGRKVKGPYGRIVLRDGTRLALTQFTADETTLRGKSLFGQEVVLPTDDLICLDVIQGKATSLADLKPAKVEQAAFLGTAWNWTANRTVRGEPLRLLEAAGESTFDRGLGTHPRTVLTYALGAKYRRFEAVVGLDAASGARGHAVVRVLVDGKEQPLPELAKLAAGPAHPIRIPVDGAKELTLIVDFGPTGDVQADVNWGDARLIE